MSVHVSSRAWSVKGLTFAEKLVLVRLADMANDEGVCWPSFGRLAADLEIDVRSVRRIAARLEAKGLLTREKRFRRKDGSQGSNWITVLPSEDRRRCDPDFEVVAPPDRAVLPPDRAVLPPGPGGPTPPDRGVLPRGDRRVLPEPSFNHQSETARASGRFDLAKLSRFQRDRLLTGNAVVLGGVLVKPDAPEWAAFVQAVRAQLAENGGASR